jgi:hypothetical protein
MQELKGALFFDNHAPADCAAQCFTKNALQAR